MFRHYKDKITAKIDEVAASFANSTDQQNARKIGNVIGSICTNLILAKGTAIVTEEVIGTIAKVTENLTNIVKGETEFAATLVDLEPSVKKTLTPFTTSLEEASEIAENACLRPNPGYKPKAPKGIIKQFDDAVVNRYEGHVFSRKHVKDGIMNLGKSKDEILSSFKKVVESVDAQGLLKQGTNQIKTKIKGFEVEVKVHIIDGKVVSFDGYMGYSERAWDNSITWF